jgi:hypothetical protein
MWKVDRHFHDLGRGIELVAPARHTLVPLMLQNTPPPANYETGLYSSFARRYTC